MENTPRPRRSDRYQAQAAPSAQAAQPMTQHPVQPAWGYPPQSNSQNPPPSPVQQAMQPRSAAPAWYQQQTGYYTQLPNQRPPQRPAPQTPVRQAQAPYGGMNPAYSQPPQRRTAPRPTQSAVPHRVESVLAETASTETADPNRLPIWLTWTIVGLCIVLLGLLAAHYLMQAYLTTRAEEWETARQNTLSYYHVVEGENGNSITYQSLIERYAAEYNLRPAFVAAIIRNESSFRTDAESSVGARGLMQLMRQQLFLRPPLRRGNEHPLRLLVLELPVQAVPGRRGACLLRLPRGADDRHPLAERQEHFVRRRDHPRRQAAGRPDQTIRRESDDILWHLRSPSLPQRKCGSCWRC